MVFGRKKKEDYNPPVPEITEKVDTRSIRAKGLMEKERKPMWSMDMMIFSDMNQIGQFIDDNAIRGRSGDAEALANWKNGLRQFYINIKSFITEPKAIQILDDYFVLLDRNLDPLLQVFPNTVDSVKQTLGVLENLTEMLFIARNDLFVKFVEIMNPKAKAYDYAYSSLPDAQRRKRIEEGLSGKDGSQNP